MKRILVTGAGGTPAINFTRSLASAPEPFHLIGVDCNKFYLQRSTCNENYLVPRADDERYLEVLRTIIRESQAEFIHTQNDAELGFISPNRENLGAKYYLPSIETVATCLDKFETYKRWSEVGLPQPVTILLSNEDDLKRAFKELGSPLWLRDTVGAAGRGSIPVTEFDVAVAWLNFKQGWGCYTAAEYLSPKSITWQSIWHNGELICAQGRERLYWEFADRAPSGITGLTGTGVTVTDPALDELAQRTIHAIDKTPNGIFSVDMTYDKSGSPNPTEINIGRFFTTHHFFTTAGLNMPYIYVKLGFGESVDYPEPRINPLPPGLAWIRGMDLEPILTSLDEIERCENDLKQRLKQVNVG